MISQDIFDTICSELAAGRSLRSICKDDGMPSQVTFFKALADESRLKQYARAREAQADAMLEEILEISDDSVGDTYTDDNGNVRTDQEVIGRSRLRVDARKWAMSKMAPKKYGDKLELAGDPENPVNVVTRIELIAGSK